MAITMQESRTARFGTLCTLYFSQGIPWFFVATALVTFLVDENSMTDDEKLALISMGMLPWIIGKLFLGPLIDRFQFRSMGRRRPWVLISQLGMAITIAAFLLIDDPADDLKMLGMFFLIHNIFAALQDVSADALAVEVLPEGEIPLANGLMFVAKGFGAMFAVLGLGSVLLYSGFQTALLVQLPVLFLIMLIPLFVLEKDGDKFLPWSKGMAGSTDTSDEEVMKFNEIISGFKLAVSDPGPRWALLLCTIMWIGGGMGTGLGIIDFQWEFLFVEELGWEAQDYLDTKALPVFFATMAGFLVGGFLGSKFGSQRVLLSAVGVGTLMTVVWSASRSNWSDQDFMTGIWLLWTLIWAIVGANLLALLMSLTTKELGGTQFSIYMTLINVGAFTGNYLSPRCLDMVGGNYANLFLIGAAFQGLVFIVLFTMGSRLYAIEDSVPSSVVIEAPASVTIGAPASVFIEDE
tara:strand:+ start:588 stop:1979 length:1392 start_codon:yes stop_codon:yes gene_type:complete